MDLLSFVSVVSLVAAAGTARLPPTLDRETKSTDGRESTERRAPRGLEVLGDDV